MKKIFIEFEEYQKVSQISKTNKIKEMLGGKWKVMILFRINVGINRFIKIEESIDGISKNILTRNLREMERHNLIERKLLEDGTNIVIYKLTNIGVKLIPVYKELSIWFFENFDQKNVKYIFKN